MSTHDHHDPENHKPENCESAEANSSPRRDRAGARGSSIVVVVTSLGVLAAVTAAFCYGIGMGFSTGTRKGDGSAAEVRDKLAGLTQELPKQRVRADEDAQDLADLHAREDLLLENYSWADRATASPRRVRIPIERAMELVAENGLPEAPSVKHAPLLAGDEEPIVPVPLTSGFARTGYEQERVRKAETRRHK